jgi:hypothetical protein
MQDKESVHKKVQEMCDCYATTDPLKEMSTISADADKQEAAYKWLALAALHGVNENAEKISVQKRGDGSVKVLAEYRKSELPTPDPALADKIVEAIADITHMEGEKGKTPMALGIRDSSIDLKVKVKKKDDGQKVTIKFPE